MRELILGGARSGKSRWAEQRACASGLAVSLIATATADDEEMHERIRQHRAERPAGWRVLEEPLALADALRASTAPERCVIVDCLTLWLSNLLAVDEARLRRETVALLHCLPELQGRVLLVSNEVGWGIVPDNPLARRFRDEAGRLHQQLAEICERVTLVTAGLPLSLKG